MKLLTLTALLVFVSALPLQAEAPGLDFRSEDGILREFPLARPFSARDTITFTPEGEVHIQQGLIVPLKEHLLSISLAFINEEDYKIALELGEVAVDIDALQHITVIGEGNLPVEISAEDLGSSLDMLPSLAAGTLCSDVVARAIVELSPDLTMGISFHIPSQPFRLGADHPRPLANTLDKSLPAPCDPCVNDITDACPFFNLFCGGGSCINRCYRNLGGHCEPELAFGSCEPFNLFCFCGFDFDPPD